jgi:hypothetical protein
MGEAATDRSGSSSILMKWWSAAQQLHKKNIDRGWWSSQTPLAV